MIITRVHNRLWTLVILQYSLRASLQHALEKNAYLARYFARHEELHAFDARVSRLLAQETMLVSYAARDLYVLTRIPIRDGFPVHVNLLANCFMQ